jgi:hypothetical protein
MKTTILLTLLLAFTACETGTKYDENETKVKVTDHHAIMNLIERKESASELVERSYIEPNHPKKVVKEETFEPKNIDFVDNGFDHEAPVPLERVAVKPVEVEVKKDNDDIQTVQHFQGGIVTDGLNVKAVRVGRHETYTRLVFDIDKWIDVNEHGGTVKTVGSYGVDYDSTKNTIVVVMDGYRGFSAKFPTFSKQSSIEKIYFNEYLDDSGFKFTIKLRGTSTIKVYDYKNPARFIIDVRPFV